MAMSGYDEFDNQGDYGNGWNALAGFVMMCVTGMIIAGIFELIDWLVDWLT